MSKRPRPNYNPESLNGSVRLWEDLETPGKIRCSGSSMDLGVRMIEAIENEEFEIAAGIRDELRTRQAARSATTT